ncbi:MAG TPA: C39 family peptidase [Gammaproteobacteria bacterium]|nr:C39 family peptidase [Gammaproteobacteria bacterium]
MHQIDQDVPFFANPDATHCFQAALKMVLGRFRPQLEHSWEELDRITGKVEGFGTWPFAGYTWLKAQALDVTNIEIMDNARFAAEGRAYLAELGGQELAQVDAGLDLAPVQAEAAVFVDAVRCEVRIPTLDDVRRAVAAGDIAVCNVNSRVLNGREGYSGHFVVVKGFDERGFVIHDPGPPGKPNRRVAFDAFEKAWSSLSETLKNLVVIRDPVARGGAAARLP